MQDMGSRELRLALYLLAAAALLLLASMAGPGAWAANDLSRPGFTIPTPTPVRPIVPTAPPVNPPPQQLPSVAATPMQGVLTLVKTAAQSLVWPGATVKFTLVATNTGTTSLRNLTIADPLPTGLSPSGAANGAAWDGSTLRASRALLPPGGRVEISLETVVAANAQPGQVIINEAQAEAEGGVRTVARAQVVLPPSELPATGARAPLRTGMPRR